MLHELLKIALNAYIYGNEAVLTQKQQNECLVANICEAKHIANIGWAVVPKTHFNINGKTYNIKECLGANTCHYDMKVRNYVVGPDHSK